MVIKIIKGKKYDFRIVCLENNGLFCFYIKAIYKPRKTYSYINNLNCILSSLDEWVDNIRIAESQWIVHKNEIKNLFNFSIELMNDNKFRDFLEKQLNTDRQIGEWNRN